MPRAAYHVFINELKILRRDISPFIVLFVMPSLALVLLTPALGAVSRESGQQLASGISLSIPAMTIMFGSLGAAFLCFAIVREHEWESWPRLLVSPAGTPSLILGKLFLPLLLVFAQQILLLLIALMIWGKNSDVQLSAYLFFSALFALNISACGLAIASSFKSMQKMNAIVHIGALLFAASSGAFIPFDQLPPIFSGIAYFTPSYWLVNYQSAAINGNLSSNLALTSTAVLLIQSSLLLVFAAAQFRRFDQR